MGSGRTYLAAFAALPTIGDPDERRRVARQGLAMLVQIAEREPAPLEGLAADQLLAAVRIVLSDGTFGELDWLSPTGAAVALFELAQALPAGPERRDLGRRVLVRLRDADRDTFVRLLISLARSSPKLLAQPAGGTADALRARTEVVLASPLTAPGAVGELALALLAQPVLAQSWVEAPATGSLPGRRFAARILAHGAREAVRRHDAGDRGGVAVMARPGLRAALDRLLADREALVWRFASTARGLLAHVDSDLAAAIDRELRDNASSSELRRGSASAAAALERGGAAARWVPMLVERAARDPGVARGTILGLAGLALSAPGEADALATALVGAAGLDAIEALQTLRREEATALLPNATTAARVWLRERLGGDPSDDGRWALLHALDAELGTEPRADGVGVFVDQARVALDAGDVPNALRSARAAIDEVVAAADWLDRASDDDPVDRRHSMRLLRELDRELLADNTLPAVLALATDSDPIRAQFAKALASIESALLAREARPETERVAHLGLRIARLRALVRLLDGVRVTDDADLEPRLAAVRQLMARAAADTSPLRRAVWAAMTRAGDALLRDGHAELTDLLLAWTTSFVDEDFAIVREASMVPELEAAFDAYARLAKPDDDVHGVIERIAGVADALPPEQSPRVESVRLALARLASSLGRLASAASHASIPDGVLDAIATELGALARRVYGARRRLGLPAEDSSSELELAARSIADRIAAGASVDEARLGIDDAVAVTVEACRQALPPALAVAMERVMRWLAARPHANPDHTATAAIETFLPPWVPLSRLLGSFFVVRPIGRGAGGSVLLAVRAEERTRADRELVAVKVPDYSGEAARNLSEHEFEQLFREEAGALLTLPKHANLAGFVTFDASTRPKPILVMEFVRGINLERTLEAGGLDVSRGLAIIDDVLAGIDAMHAMQIAHLDVKPANVVLRDGSGVAVLVDFGLAGRRLRTGCGSAHYGAAEVWSDATNVEPFGADIYAAACLAFEILTNTALIRGDTLQRVIDEHFAPQPGAAVLSRLARVRHLAPLGELLRVAVSRDPKR
ncbi:MAG TPA: protein kinase, partial [Kofleriaceae bacterium]|nr:protein kinase [Kofleriaceae bacterium]